MPYYAYIDLHGDCQSPNTTFDPMEIKDISTKYRKVNEPVANPVYDVGQDKFRSMTADEITSKNEELAEAKFQSDVESLNICTKLELSEAMDTLNLSEVFESFKALPKFDLTHDFRFDHPIVVGAMAGMDSMILQSIKEQIITNRGI